MTKSVVKDIYPIQVPTLSPLIKKEKKFTNAKFNNYFFSMV